MKNTWKLESFTAEQINENIDKKVFTIPMYQRGVVWSQSQKDILIDTIKKGLPFCCDPKKLDFLFRVT